MKLSIVAILDSNVKAEDAGDMFLRNVGMYIQVHVALLPTIGTDLQ
jgi:hypothetical protein